MKRLTTLTLVSLALVLSACASAETATNTTDAAESAAPQSTSSSAPIADQPTPPSPASSSSTSSEPTSTTSIASTSAAPVAEDAPASECRRFTDFETTDEIDAWFVVNDGVMGGLSSGGPSFDASAVAFTGFINTDGGGFSSIRAALAPGDLSDIERIELRVRGDGRGYELTFRDSVERPFRLISHQARIPFEANGQWQTVSIPLSELETSSVGVIVDTEPFDASLATEIGVILADGLDGDFSIELDWIDFCGGGAEQSP